MTRLPQPNLFAFLTICVAGCAASPIVDGDLSDESEVDSGFESIEAEAPEPSDDDEPGVDPNAGLSDVPSPETPGGAQRPDAGASSAGDAGGTPTAKGADADSKDALVKDASVQDAGVKDTGAKDAGAKDAGPADSGASGAPTRARDAGQPTTKPAAGTCRAASDCTESCLPLGIFNCCKSNGSCGCTWAIGAYCQ